MNDATDATLKDMVTMMICDDVQESIRFYTDALGFTVSGRMDDVGKSGWASLNHGRIQIMLASPTQNLPFDTESAWLQRVDGSTTINTRVGDDEVIVTNEEQTISAGDVIVDTGSGNDLVQIEGKSRFDSDLRIVLGGGSDALRFLYEPAEDILAGLPLPPRVFGQGFVLGGGGDDTLLTGSQVWVLSDPVIVSIEHFIET